MRRIYITTRQELCDELIYLKEHANVKLTEVIPAILKLTQKKIEAVENPESECNISDVLLYLQMCYASFEIGYFDLDFADDMDSLRKSIKSIYRDKGISLEMLAKQSRVPSRTIDNFLYRKGNLTVDAFLAIVNALDTTLQIC